MSEPHESLRGRARAARARIQSGALRGAELRDLLVAVPVLDREAWVDELLAVEPPPPDEDLPRGAVPYLPCAVEAILAMMVEAPVGRDDTVVDLGSGLGRVVILAHLLTGATAVGIEIQEQLIRSSRARADELALDRVSFVHADAAELRLDGSIFVLYAPFNGEMLTRVLHRLEEVARRRPIIVCTVDLELDVAWLTARPSSSVALTIYDSSC